MPVTEDQMYSPTPYDGGDNQNENEDQQIETLEDDSNSENFKQSNQSNQKEEISNEDALESNDNTDANPKNNDDKDDEDEDEDDGDDDDDDDDASDLYKEDDNEEKTQAIDTADEAESVLELQSDSESEHASENDDKNNEEDVDDDDEEEEEEEDDNAKNDAGSSQSDDEKESLEHNDSNNEDESTESTKESSSSSDEEEDKQEIQNTKIESSISSNISNLDADVDQNLLQKQANYIIESGMLDRAEFKSLDERQKLTAILTMLNSNPATKLTMPQETAPVESQIYDTTSNINQQHQKQERKLTPAEKRRLAPRPDLTRPMTQEERERYSAYLRGENKITEMHNIPLKSRLFIGNLPLKNVSKEDLFRIFSPYGHILQINIKNAYGFIQYNNPQSVKDAIELESNEMNFSKKLILEVSSSNSRPQFDHGDHGTNNSTTFISSSKRPFDNADEDDGGDMYSDGSAKKSKRRTPACVIYVKKVADRGYANEVFKRFRNSTGLETDMIFLRQGMDLRKLVNDAAYDGVWGVVFLNKSRNVDIQTFYKGPRGETKFDEYINVSLDDTISIFTSLKNGTGPTGHQLPMPNNAKNAYGYNQPIQPMGTAQGPPPPPQQQQQQQQQGYYPGYGMQAPPQQQQNAYVQQGYGIPQAPQQQQSDYNQMNQGYGRYQGNMSGVPPVQNQMNQSYGRYQNPNMQPLSQQQQQPVQPVQMTPPVQTNQQNQLTSLFRR
ncbi:Nab3p NDAI_0D00990 [Naumovozyma dairenensis CBS 421]|uniref:RRM domain-containing protein n=1 Tax=Naumovozyma dairenensis (strain ATCC 10597 / BCRC 20456 / CBS 421 / NBRC 0211 / NRRL Y-12639) TaxID=1071378 RepID=G0W9F1_NAUDC|nr:hypothetical protein NDAI_0D00990 [Naumovozyma dairenensis CBS 421]CCD24412.1 hypothetical protein NDAI_0D00990 [Naumovozyma dairenensis CBS 421]